MSRKVWNPFPSSVKATLALQELAPTDTYASKVAGFHRASPSTTLDKEKTILNY